MKAQDPSLVYCWYLRKCNAADSRVAGKVDPLAMKLLEEIAIAELTRTPLMVRDLKATNLLAEPAVIYQKLKQLEFQGWVCSEICKNTKPDREIRITNKTKKFFSQRGKLLLSAALT